MLLAVATFTAAAVLIILLPGPDTLVVLRSMVRGGRSRGLATARGVLTGLTVWVGVAALGLAALLRASHVGYDVLRIAGATYLVWLGVQSLRSRSLPAAGAEAEEAPGRGGVLGTGFLAGLVTNLLNPKIGVFFVTFLPGFVPHGDPVGLTSLLFGAVFVVLTLGYFLALVTLAAQVMQWMSRPRIRRRMELVTGGVLIGFGIRLAVES